jgi:hypothetical protein
VVAGEDVGLARSTVQRAPALVRAGHQRWRRIAVPEFTGVVVGHVQRSDGDVWHGGDDGYGGLERPQQFPLAQVMELAKPGSRKPARIHLVHPDDLLPV